MISSSVTSEAVPLTCDEGDDDAGDQCGEEAEQGVQHVGDAVEPLQAGSVNKRPAAVTHCRGVWR